MIQALRQIGRDQMGKDAIKAALKKIEVRNSKGASSPTSSITFHDGQLTIDHDLCNVGDTKARADYIIEVVEKDL